ncbi:MAG: alpha-glucosidase [Candidatus Eremiobacteraeota bacterium]|nr:alpha-glucosidase [Candidatus Eremiobacteraeota bacterium]
MTWTNAPHHRHHAVHSHIYRLHYALGEFRAPRSWNVVELTQQVSSDFRWDGNVLSHPEWGPLLELVAPVDGREAQLSDYHGQLLARPGDQLPPGPASHEIRLRLRRDKAAAYYGLGQRMGPMRRDPGSFCNWTVDPPNSGHHRGIASMYQAHPYLMLHRPGMALGLFLNSTWFSRFDLGLEHEDEIVICTLGGEAELFALVAQTPAELNRRLAELTGFPMQVPLWSLGFHQSRWGYREQTEIAELVSQFRRRQIPLDVVHLDIDYMDDFRSYSFHPERFPDPKGLAEEVGAQGVRLVTIIDPGIRFDLHSGYEVARQGSSGGHFLRNRDGSPFSAYCWPDAALFTDYSKESAREWWGEQQSFLQDRGIAGVWIDMNEPATFASPFSEGFSSQLPIPLGLPSGAGDDVTVHAEVHNLYGHQMAQATHQGLLKSRPQETPWVLTRSAFVGTQKWAISWMGDNHSWWEHLALTLPQLTSMGLSGAPLVGVDIGGFFGSTHAELFERWMEQAVFYPFMRNHSALGTRAQEPWAFGPEVEQRVREHIQRRYQLLPYLEELARQSHEQGSPILRPLFYEFPEDPESALHEDQAMLGDAILIAPITRPGHTHRQVYFPAGSWYDFWSERVVEGPTFEIWQAPLGKMPTFLRGGRAIPLDSPRLSTQHPVQQRIWWIFPEERKGTARRGDQVLHWQDDQVTLEPSSSCQIVIRRKGTRLTRDYP